MGTNLYSIGQWVKDKGLVGETESAIVATTILISGKPLGFGIESAAGAGKTELMNKIVGIEDKNDGLIDQKHIMFKEAGSEKSLFYSQEKMKGKKILVFTELQKDKGDTTQEIIKSN